MSQIVYLNQEYLPLEEAKISVMDRGFLLADSIYEVIPIYGAIPFAPQEHFTRLCQGLDKIKLKIPFSYDEFVKIITTLIKVNSPQPMQSFYFQITRGVSMVRKQFENCDTPTIFAKIDTINRQLSSTLDLTAITVTDIRWKRCDIKGTNRLSNILMMQQAYSEHADEAILINNGYAIEGASSNLFIVENNIIITPPASESLLSGVTRKILIELIKPLYELREEPIPIDRLFTADEVWLTASTKEVALVTQINGQLINKRPKEATIAVKIHQVYTNYINNLIKDNLKQNQLLMSKP